jgi:stage V sporulation protein D (sporulation-specific penicillin-binding protein)
MAYGYEVAVTPIQILAAYGAVANGGILLKPYLVKKIVNANNETIEEGRTQIVRRVLSEPIAGTLTRFFEGVVERGTATQAKIEGIRIAGKTGTSRNYSNSKGGYTASFVGFFPVEDPQIVCLVMVDNPRQGSYFGGEVCAPIFRLIAERMMSTKLQVPRSNRGGLIARADTSALHSVPDVRAMKLDAARGYLASNGCRTEIVGEGDIVSRQSPEPGSKIKHGEIVTLFLTARDKQVADGYVEIPDLRGLTIRHALNRLVLERMVPSVNGSGIVISQNPSPGEKVKIGTRIQLNCEPKKSVAASMN